MLPASALLLLTLAAASSAKAAGPADPLTAAQALEAKGDLEGAATAYRRIAEDARRAGDTYREALAQNRLGLAQHTLGKEREALDAHLRALELRKERPGTGGLAQTQNNLGIVYGALGNAAKEREHLEYAFVAGTGEPERRVISGVNLAAAYRRSGDFRRAKSLFEQLERTLEPSILAGRRPMLDYAAGKLHADFDRHAEAELLLARARDGYARATGADRSTAARAQAYAALELARLARSWGRAPLEASAASVDEAERLFRKRPHPDGRFQVALERALRALAAGNDTRARRLLAAARVLAGAMEDAGVRVAQADLTLASLELDQGHASEAAAAAEKALVAVQRAGQLTLEASAHATLGQAAFAAGDLDLGLARSARALRLWGAHGAFDAVVRERARVARILVSHGRPRAAAQELADAKRHLPRVHSHRTWIAYLLAAALLDDALGDESAAEEARADVAARAKASDDVAFGEDELASFDRARATLKKAAPAAAPAPSSRPATAGTEASPTRLTIEGKPVAPARPGPLRLGPTLATATAAPTGEARYRFVLENRSELDLDVELHVGLAQVTEVRVSDERLELRASAGSPAGNAPLHTRVLAHGAVPIFVRVAGSGEPGDVPVALSARSGGVEARASFLARFGDGPRQGLVGVGVELDPVVWGVDFFHEVEAAQGSGLGLVVTPSRPSRIELLDATTGEALAIDAEGDGDFAGRGDALFLDRDGDLRPDVPGGRGPPAPFVVVAFPTAEILAGGTPLEIEVRIVDRAGRTVGSRTDVVLPPPDAR